MPNRITCPHCSGHGKETSPTGKMHECRQCSGYGYTTAPTRITLSRAKGWRKPEGAIIVARRPGGIWGNPWRIGTPGTLDIAGARHISPLPIDATKAMQLFASLVYELTIDIDYLPPVEQFTPEDRQALRDAHYARYRLINANIDQLRGHDLCCWCKPGQPCHADVLLQLANGGG